MRDRSVPRQLGQVLARFGVEETGADHDTDRIRPAPLDKGVRRTLKESGYIYPGALKIPLSYLPILLGAPLFTPMIRPGFLYATWFRSGLHAKLEIPWLARLWPLSV